MLDSEQWSEGAKLEAFEERWAEWNGLPSLGLSSWAGGALAALEFAGVTGETVLCPSNTFMATPLAAIGAGAEVEFVDCNRERPLHVLRGLRAQGRAAQAAGRDPRPHRRPHRLRRRADRRLLPRERDLPARGLRPRPRRRLERRQAGRLRRRRRLLALRDQDRLHRRGRRARLRQRGADRVRPQVPQLRQVRARGRRPQLPHERVHRRPRRWSRPSGWRRSSPGRTSTPASTSTRSTRPGWSCPRG